jgi:hypothetical protein
MRLDEGKRPFRFTTQLKFRARYIDRTVCRLRP